MVYLRTILLISAILAIVQIGPSSLIYAETFVANLSGSNEVPPVDTAALGYALVRNKSNEFGMNYEVNITGLFNITGASMQLESTGQNGLVIVDLLKGSDTETTKLGLGIKGNITDLSLIGPAHGKGLSYLNSAIRSGDTYVNIRTYEHPDGEIRGQLGSSNRN